MSDRLALVKATSGILRQIYFYRIFAEILDSVNFEQIFQAVTMRVDVCWGVTFLLPTNRLETINPFIKIH